MDCFLGIDTSYYTTSIAATDIHGNIIYDKRIPLRVELGKRGLRQSEAVFQHLKNIPTLFGSIIENGLLIKAVCASAKPRRDNDSYMPVFVVGDSFAKTISKTMKIDFYTTTHQHGHIIAALTDNKLINNRFLALHLSGGTTEILLVTKDKYDRIIEIELLGGTLDITAGQLIDRIGVFMDLDFPAGKQLERLAVFHNEYKLPVSVVDMDCNFSGAEAQAMKRMAKVLEKNKLAYSIFKCIADTMCLIIKNAVYKTEIKDILLFGGVYSNKIIKDIIKREFDNMKENIVFSKKEFSSDNAVGLARLANINYKYGGIT